jgi:hypothetical protein
VLHSTFESEALPWPKVLSEIELLPWLGWEHQEHAVVGVLAESYFVGQQMLDRRDQQKPLTVRIR